MVEDKKSIGTKVFKEAKRLSKEFGFTVGMLKGSLADSENELIRDALALNSSATTSILLNFSLIKANTYKNA